MICVIEMLQCDLASTCFEISTKLYLFFFSSINPTLSRIYMAIDFRQPDIPCCSFGNYNFTTNTKFRYDLITKLLYKLERPFASRHSPGISVVYHVLAALK